MPEHLRTDQQGAERDLARRAERLWAVGLKADTGVPARASGVEVVVAHAPGRETSRAPFLMCFSNRSASFPHSLCRPAL